MRLNLSSSIVCSLTLHLLVAFLLFFGVNIPIYKQPHEQILVMDLVTVAELSNVPRRKSVHKLTHIDVKAEKPKPPQVKPTEEPEPKLEQKPELIPPKEKAGPLQEVKPNPEIPKPELEKKPKPPAKNEQPKKDNPIKKPAQKQTETKPKKKKPSDPFLDADFLKSLEESASKHRANDDLQELLGDLQADNNNGNNDFDESLPMTMSEKDAIASQIQRAWNVSSFNGAENAGMQVIVRFTLDANGNVLQADPVREYNSSPQYEAFVESALRAVRIASPIKGLPPEKINSWQSIELRFDSSGMIY
jgi:colicin import membrane protein